MSTIKMISSIGHKIAPHIFIDSKENIRVATFGGGMILLNFKLLIKGYTFAR